ncbi:hypothetical protein JXM83_07470 [Candidatus Woesearchaeota archaeon]|nr:hypothetical protein [Candidatus Woesearchaeota archaeon]
MRGETIVYSSMAVILITSMFMNLMDIAQNTADRTLVFATDMNLAIECATRGISVFECSPNLDPEPFKEQLKQTQEYLQKTTNLEKINLTQMYNNSKEFETNQY